MKYTKKVLKEYAKVINDHKNYRNNQEIADKLDVKKEKLVYIKSLCKKNGIKINNFTRGVQVERFVDKDDLSTHLKQKKLNQELKDEKKKNKDLLEKVESDNKIKDLIGELNEKDLRTIPEFLNKNIDNNSRHGVIPTLFISDVHFDEIVKIEQIAGINKYDRDTAVKRLRYTFDSAINITGNYMNLKFDGFVCAFGGDMLSGNIHEELRENNEAPILESVIKLSEELITGIEKLKQKFKKVFVPMVVGNHGRLDKKMRMKYKVQDNFEYILYHYIAKHFKNDKNVSCYVSESSDCQYSVYSTKFLLTHGDQFKGGNGIAGIFSPIMRNDFRKRTRQSAVNNPYDVLLIGHFHQLITTKKLIVNGSVKGYDEYAYNSNFDYEPPQQALFITHPKFGNNYQIAINCNGYENSENIEIDEENYIKVFKN